MKPNQMGALCCLIAMGLSLGGLGVVALLPLAVGFVVVMRARSR